MTLDQQLEIKYDLSTCLFFFRIWGQQKGVKTDVSFSKDKKLIRLSLSLLNGARTVANKDFEYFNKRQKRKEKSVSCLLTIRIKAQKTMAKSFKDSSHQSPLIDPNHHSQYKRMMS